MYCLSFNHNKRKQEKHTISYFGSSALRVYLINSSTLSYCMYWRILCAHPYKIHTIEHKRIFKKWIPLSGHCFITFCPKCALFFKLMTFKVLYSVKGHKQLFHKAVLARSLGRAIYLCFKPERLTSLMCLFHLKWLFEKCKSSLLSWKINLTRCLMSHLT